MVKRKSLQDKELAFEEALGKLEEIVEQMENGDLLLEEALAKFTEGMTLSKLCLDKLNYAEQQIHMILKDETGKATEKPFEITGEEKC
jgi:exodeoxyribonuclease VII small subunit